jgi:hypothetical protein
MSSDGLKMVLLTVVIASSIIGVNSAFADTKKETNQNLSLPITVGVHNANRGGDDSSNDDGPPPAVLDKDRSSSLMLHTDDSSDDDGPPPAVSRVEDSDWTTADNNTVPEKYMKGLSNCESSAAADGHLKLAEIIDCFHKVF